MSKPTCGCCTKHWFFTKVALSSGTTYNVSFDACNVNPLNWAVRVEGCRVPVKQGTVNCVSGDVQCQINLSGVDNGVYELVGSSANCEGESVPFTFTIGSGVVIPEPLSPPILEAESVNADTIELNWVHSGATDYFTQVSFDGETWSDLTGGIYSNSLRTAEVTDLETDTLYFFRMKARQSTGESSNFSNVVSVTATDENTDPFSRKVLCHNQVEWNWSSLSSNDSKVAKVVQGGVTHITFTPAWWWIEPQQDVYDFSIINSVVTYFQGKGLKVVLQCPFLFAFDGMLNASSNAYIDLGAAILLRSGRRATSNIEGAWGCKANPVYAARQLKLIARIADYVNNNPVIKANCEQFLFIDGGSNETGFYTSEFGGNIDDADYNNATTNDFKVWLQGKYSTVSALNSAWGVNLPTFNAVEIGHYRPPLYSGQVGYNDNQRTKDWFKYLTDSHKAFYQKVIQAIKNPNSVDSALTSTNTGIKVAAYLTEGLTGQGVFWASGVVSMLRDFDIIFSSIGAADGAHVGGNYLKGFARMMSLLRGTLPTKEFGQEMDKDVLNANGHRIGPSRLMRTIFAQGATWAIYVFYDTEAEWDEAVYYSINGTTLSFLADSQLGVSTYVTGQSRTLPTVSSTMTYNWTHVLTATNNPNNTNAGWVSAVNPDEEGLSTTYVDIKETTYE